MCAPRVTWCSNPRWWAANSPPTRRAQTCADHRQESNVGISNWSQRTRPRNRLKNTQKATQSSSRNVHPNAQERSICNRAPRKRLCTEAAVHVCVGVLPQSEGAFSCPRTSEQGDTQDDLMPVLRICLCACVYFTLLANLHGPSALHFVCLFGVRLCWEVVCSLLETKQIRAHFFHLLIALNRCPRMLFAKISLSASQTSHAQALPN